jgi:hypothetical protein
MAISAVTLPVIASLHGRSATQGYAKATLFSALMTLPSMILPLLVNSGKSLQPIISKPSSSGEMVERSLFTLIRTGLPTTSGQTQFPNAKLPPVSDRRQTTSDRFCEVALPVRFSVAFGA